MADMSSQATKPETMAPVPDPEVMAKAARRRFSAQYELRILREADVVTEPALTGFLQESAGGFPGARHDPQDQARLRPALRDLAA